MKDGSGYARAGCLALMAVTLWLNGLGCALCCSTVLAEECCDAEPSGEAAGGCCVGLPGDLTDTGTEMLSQPVSLRACKLLPNQSAPAVLPQAGDHLASPPAASAPLFTPQGAGHVVPAFHLALPQNRGDTWLRCRVLLI